MRRACPPAAGRGSCASAARRRRCTARPLRATPRAASARERQRASFGRGAGAVREAAQTQHKGSRRQLRRHSKAAQSQLRANRTPALPTHLPALDKVEELGHVQSGAVRVLGPAVRGHKLARRLEEVEVAHLPVQRRARSTQRNSKACSTNEFQSVAASKGRLEGGRRAHLAHLLAVLADTEQPLEAGALLVAQQLLEELALAASVVEPW